MGNEYTYKELGHLYSMIWDQLEERKIGGSKNLTLLERGLVISCFNWVYLPTHINKEIMDILEQPLTDMPLYVNSYKDYEKVIYKWRLDIGR